VTFCLINFQGTPDLLPLFPFIGIFVGFLLIEIGASIESAGRLGFSRDFATFVTTAALLLFAALMGVRNLMHSAEPVQSLEDQNQAFQAVAAVLKPDDKIYAHGTLELLVLLKKQNATPYIMFDEGKDDFITQEKYGGSFQGVLDELDAQAPKIIALSRLRRVSHGAAFVGWVLERYRELPVNGYDSIYVRKE